MAARVPSWIRSFLLLSVAPTLAFSQGAGGGQMSAPGSQGPVQPVRLTTVGYDGEMTRVGEELRFGVRVEGERVPVNLKLMNPQPGMIFDPVMGARPPFTAEVRWKVPEGTGEKVELRFRVGPSGATPSLGGTPGLRVPIPVNPSTSEQIKVGDITGDGIPDVVAVATLADHNDVVNSGVAFYWIGSTTPSGTPSGSFELQDPKPGDQFGKGADPSLQLVDINFGNRGVGHITGEFDILELCDRWL